jgi:hypothetical protein
VIYILSLLPALVALAGLTVALTARHRVLAASGAGLSTLVFAAFAYVGTDYGYPAAGWLLGSVAALNLLLAVAVATEFRPPAKPQPQPAPAARGFVPLYRDDLFGHTVTVEDGPAGRVVAERGNGLLVKVVRSEGELLPGESIFAAARAAAVTYRAEYVSGMAGSASSARADLAVDNILGGAR